MPYDTPEDLEQSQPSYDPSETEAAIHEFYDEEPEEHAALLPAAGEGNASEGRSVASRMTDAQRRQIRIWILEGYTYQQACAFMDERWGFHVARSAWNYHRANKDGLTEAAAFLKGQYGESQRDILFQATWEHFRRLLHLIRSRGIYQVERQQIGWGEKAATVTSEKFDAQMSRELRETITQLLKYDEGRQRIAQMNTVNIFGAEVAAPFLEALRFQREMPALSPSASLDFPEPEPEFIDAEVEKE